LRAYKRELKRLVLWLVIVRDVALSSMTVEDCEAYKDFLKAPSESFVGPKRPRSSGRWRPFASDSLSPDSQAYAVRAIRAAFAWLTTVRYLAGNPWSAVTDPATLTREVEVQVDRALPTDLWTRVRAELDARCNGEALCGLTPTVEEARQWRIARGAILLMGNSGVRRDEAANARRENLNVAVVTATGSSADSSANSATEQRSVWALGVIGKRRKQRTVPVSAATVAALRAHWADRGLDFDAARAEGPLIAPVVINGTDASQAKHGGASDGKGRESYQPHALYAAEHWRDLYAKPSDASLKHCCAKGRCHTMRTSNSSPPRRTRSGIPSVPRRLHAACRSMWRNASWVTRHCRLPRSTCEPRGSACLMRRQNIIQKTEASLFR